MAKTASKKATKAPKKATKAPRTRKGVESYKSYIFKVLRASNPKLGIGKKAMDIMNSYATDSFKRIAAEAGNLAQYAEKKTLSSHEVESAVKLLLPTELKGHAIKKGEEALGKYMKQETSKKPNSEKAGLHFPVGRIKRYLKEGFYAPRVSLKAAVYLAAVLEYLTGEVLELAAEATKKVQKERIIARHIKLAVLGDEELNQFLGGVTIAGGGVEQHIHKELTKGAKEEGGASYMASRKRKSKAKPKKTAKRAKPATPKPAARPVANFFSSWF